MGYDHPQPIAATASQMQTDAHDAPGSNLATIGDLPAVTVPDSAVPGGHYEIYVECTTSVTVKSGNTVIGYNYTKGYAGCSKNYKSLMTPSHPGFVVDNAVDGGSIVAVILPESNDTYAWVAVPLGSASKPTSWQRDDFAKANRSKDQATFTSVMARVPTIVGSAVTSGNGDTIGVAPFPGRVEAGVIAQKDLAVLIERLTNTK